VEVYLTVPKAFLHFIDNAVSDVVGLLHPHITVDDKVKPNVGTPAAKYG
jgi:hypothetical protein